MRASRYIPVLLVVLTAAAALFAIATARASSGAEFKGFHVDVSVTPKRLGPISVQMKRAHTADGELIAAIVFTNHAKKMARMTDSFRDAGFAVGGTGRQLYVADEGCFKSESPQTASICQKYLDRVDMEPGRRGDRVLTAWANGYDMDPLSPGRYEYVRPVRFGFPQGTRAPVKVDLIVTYNVTAAP